MGRRSVPPEPPLPQSDRNNPSPQDLPRNNRPRRSVSSSPAAAKLSSPAAQSDSANPRTCKASSRKKSKAAECAPHEEANVIPIGELEENKALERQEDNGAGGHDAEPAADIADIEKEEAECQGGNDESQDDEEEDDENDEEESGSLEALGEGFYEVEAVRRKRVRKGQVQYFIKWRGWSESANTWEPFNNVQACADIIEEFENSLATKQNRRGRGKRKFGTYLLPQKKKRSILYNTGEEGGAANLGVDTVGVEEDAKKPGSEPSDISRESPEGLRHSRVPGGESADARRKTSQGVSINKELDGSMPDCRLESDQEVLQENVILSDAGHEAVVLNASVNQQERRPGSSSATVLKADISPSKQQPQEKLSPSVDGERGPFSLFVGGETGSSSPFVGEEAASVCKEKNVQDSMANGHHDTKEELKPTETGCSEQQLTLTSEGVVLERKTLGKETGRYSSSSCPEEMTSGELGKAIGNDKCIGAKKRKQGFVRRVRQRLNSQELDTKATIDEENLKDSAEVSEQGNVLKEPELGMQEGREDQLGAQLPEPQILDPKASTVASPIQQDGSHFNPPAGSPPHITKIIKAVNYSNAPVNGKQDVAVLFKALRADGEEVLVDNKFMRANYPILLIEFYEQHLRYSPSTAV